MINHEEFLKLVTEQADARFYAELRKYAKEKANASKRIIAKITKPVVKLSSFGATISENDSVQREIGTQETNWVQKHKEHEQKFKDESIEQTINPETGTHISLAQAETLKNLRNELAEMFTVCPKPNQGSEYDSDVEVYDKDGNPYSELGATRSPNGNDGVRIRFKG